jgi:hypothetical protein
MRDWEDQSHFPDKEAVSNLTSPKIIQRNIDLVGKNEKRS